MPDKWNINKIKKRAKIVVTDDGQLVYPHKFVVGSLIRCRNKHPKGFGLIIKIEYPNMTVFWQNSGEYAIYDIPVSTLKFTIET